MSPDKRPWNETLEFVGLRSETFDIRLVSTGLSGCMLVLSQLASITIGATWILNREMFKIFAPHVDVETLQTLLGDA